MKISPRIVTPEDDQPELNVLGTRVRVLATNQETNGQEFTLQSGDQGMGPPLHSHDWDESFYVIKGSIEFTCAGETLVCRPGTFVYVPAGTVHAFRYGCGGGEMLEMTGIGSQATQMFKAFDKELPSTPPDRQKVLEVLRRNGVTAHIDAA